MSTRVDADNAVLNSFLVTKLEYKKLKQLYTRAEENKEETFVFNGITLLTAYAKYVIEFLESTRGWK